MNRDNEAIRHKDGESSYHCVEINCWLYFSRNFLAQFESFSMLADPGTL